MHGLVVIEGMTLSGHPWIINEITFIHESMFDIGLIDNLAQWP